MKQENEDIARKMQYILNMRPVFNKEALFSDGTRYYRNPTEPKSGEKVIISFRTQKNNVDAVYLVSGDQKYKMKVYKTTSLVLYASACCLSTALYLFYRLVYMRCHYQCLKTCASDTL